MNLIRDVVAYNRFHVRRVMNEDHRWFKDWPDKPVHEHQPLRRPEFQDRHDFFTFVRPWKKEEAVISFQGTGTYHAGGNAFWLNPFVDESRQNMTSIAGDPPTYSACLDAAETYAMSKIQHQALGVTQGEVSAACEARIMFPHSFTTFRWDLAAYEADHFDGSLPLVSGHVNLWGFHLAMCNALTSGDMAHVAVLVQAALCAPIEGVIVDSMEKLSIISMEISESAGMQYDYMKSSFPAFSRKLMLALEGISPQPATALAKLDFCRLHGIRYNGTVVYRSMLTAAQNCSERLNDNAIRTLVYIHGHRGSSKIDLAIAFNTLNRILQVCAKEVDQTSTNAAMWRPVTVTDLINHVLEYIAWALDHERVEGGGVTTVWLEKRSRVPGGEGCGAMRLVMAKVYVRIFLKTHVMDLPDASLAKKEFLSVLTHFAGYEVFARAFGTKKSGASSSAADDDEKKKTDSEAADRTLTEAPVDDPFTKMRERTAGFAVKLLEFLFDLFSQTLDHILSEFLTSDANANQAVCRIRWEDWQQQDFVEIRRTLRLHRMTVPASVVEASEMPAAA